MIELKKILLLLLLISATQLDAQNIKGAVVGGINALQVDGDEVFGYHKLGYTVGASAITPLGKNLYFVIENIFNQKGANKKGNSYEDTLNGAYKLNMNYVEVPFLICYEDNDGLMFGAGFSWGRLVKIQEFEHEYRTSTALRDGTYKGSDLDFLADVRFRIYKGWRFNFRYAYSIASIRTRIYKTGEKREQFHNMLTFRLVYVFRDKPKENNKKIKD